MERKWNFFTIKIELATKILIIILVNCSRWERMDGLC
jgi:hypothetical protein